MCPPTNPLPNHLPGLSLPQPTAHLLSIFMHPPILDTSYKRNRALCGPSCLAPSLSIMFSRVAPIPHSPGVGTFFLFEAG